MPDTVMRIPIYIRVSSDDQVHGTSLDTQLRECRAAVMREGLTAGEVFADEGESAKTVENRPAFMRLLDHIKAEGCPAVMVHKIDRFARNNLEAQIVRSRLHKLGCRLLSATEPISDDPSGKFMFDVLSAVAEYDNRLRAERCRGGMASQVKEGWWVHTAPLGYLTARSPENKPTLKLDENKAPLIAEAFSLAAQGVPQVEILDILKQRGLLTRSGKYLNKATLSRILSNQVYAGLMKGKLASGKLTKGKWPAIVPENIFKQAQDRSLVGKRPRLANTAFPLRGFLSCGDCGKKLTASTSAGQTQRYSYYHCPACGLRFPELAVEEAIHREISRLAMPKNVLDGLESLLHEMMRDSFSPVKSGKALAAKQVAMLEEKLDRLIELRLSDGISRDMYDRKKIDIEDKLIMARRHLDAMDVDKVDLVAEFDRARQLLSNPGHYWHTAGAAERRLSFGLFFQGPVRLTRGNKKLGTPLVESSKSCIWYTRRDSNSRPPV